MYDVTNAGDARSAAARNGSNGDHAGGTDRKLVSRLDRVVSLPPAADGKLTRALTKARAVGRRHTHRYLFSGRELDRLAKSDHPAGPVLAQAIRTAVDGSVSEEARAWADRIEALRQELLRSTDRLEHAGRVTVGEVCDSASRPPQWALLLFEIVRGFRPEHALELGTSLGMSASYEAAALELNGAGRLLTLEGSEAIVKLARANFEQLGLADRIEVVPGYFENTLQPTLDRLGSVGYAFVDGNHDRDATLTYFEQLSPHLVDGAVVVFDDISWSPGMADAWTRLRTDPRISLSVDLFKVGICVVGGPRLPRQQYTVAID